MYCLYAEPDRRHKGPLDAVHAFKAGYSSGKSTPHSQSGYNSIYVKAKMRVLQTSIVIMLLSFVRAAVESSSPTCPAVYNDTSSSSIQLAMDSTQQIAILTQKLEDTQNLLHLSQTHSSHSAFSYRTFLSGMLMALLLVGVPAFLFWSYIQQKLQRKQQVAVVGGLKDMDDSTLKKVLGEVGIAIFPTCCI